MARFDTIKKFRWRSMTTQEVNELNDWFALRRDVLNNPQNYEGADMPEAPGGVHTAEGAAHWAIGILWQDTPWLLMLGTTALVGKLVLAVWNIAQALTR